MQMTNPVNEVADELKDLTSAERSEVVADLIAQFADQMLDNNQRIFSRVLDLIAATNAKGDETLHLDMLATHLTMDT